jgi:hypothetical protein
MAVISSKNYIGKIESALSLCLHSLKSSAVSTLIFLFIKGKGNLPFVSSLLLLLLLPVDFGELDHVVKGLLRVTKPSALTA